MAIEQIAFIAFPAEDVEFAQFFHESLDLFYAEATQISQMISLIC